MAPVDRGAGLAAGGGAVPWRGTAARALTPPLGRALPTRYVVGGHSAGGHFAGAVGARLDANGYSDLAGAVLLDPVASGGFSADLMALSDGGERPVLAVAARPNVANLFNNAFGALEALPSDYTGVQLVWSGFRFGWPYGGSCHTDAEGDDGDVIGNAAAPVRPHGDAVRAAARARLGVGARPGDGHPHRGVLV